MLTVIIDAMTAHLGPDYDPASGEDFATLRRHLDKLERATADRLPPVAAADLKDDRETRRACEDWRDRRYACVDVTTLKGTGDDDVNGETWTIIRGSSRYEVREVPRYEARPSPRSGSGFWYVHDHEQADEATPDDGTIHEAGHDPDADGFGQAACEDLARRLNNDADPVWIVWDTDNDARAEVGEHIPSYDPTAEDDARDAARQGNVENHRENGCGWPFAWNYAHRIGEREADDFDRTGFIVATHEPSGQTYAGIDGGGYSFTDQHWMPLYLAHLTSRFGSEYVRTDKGLRRLAR